MILKDDVVVDDVVGDDDDGYGDYSDDDDGYGDYSDDDDGDDKTDQLNFDQQLHFLSMSQLLPRHVGFLILIMHDYHDDYGDHDHEWEKYDHDDLRTIIDLILIMMIETKIMIN